MVCLACNTHFNLKPSPEYLKTLIWILFIIVQSWAMNPLTTFSLSEYSLRHTGSHHSLSSLVSVPVSVQFSMNVRKCVLAGKWEFSEIGSYGSWCQGCMTLLNVIPWSFVWLIHTFQRNLPMSTSKTLITMHHSTKHRIPEKDNLKTVLSYSE